MVAVAHRCDHVSAVVAEVLDRFLAGDVSLVRHEDGEDEDKGPDDQPDHPALEASVSLERQVGPRQGHEPPSRFLVQILMGRNIGG